MLYKTECQDVSHYNVQLTTNANSNAMLCMTNIIAHLSNCCILHFTYTETTAFRVTSSLVPTIATSATCGCPMRNARTIVRTVAFAVSAVPKTLSTVTTAACASIVLCTIITIARTESTSPIVPSVRNIFSRRVRPVTKCPVDMPFIGTVSVS